MWHSFEKIRRREGMSAVAFYTYFCGWKWYACKQAWGASIKSVTLHDWEKWGKPDEKLTGSLPSLEVNTLTPHPMNFQCNVLEQPRYFYTALGAMRSVNWSHTPASERWTHRWFRVIRQVFPEIERLRLGHSVPGDVSLQRRSLPAGTGPQSDGGLRRYHRSVFRAQLTRLACCTAIHLDLCWHYQTISTKQGRLTLLASIPSWADIVRVYTEPDWHC